MSSTSSLSSDDRAAADIVEKNTKPKGKKTAAKSAPKAAAKTAMKNEAVDNAAPKASVKKETSDKSTPKKRGKAVKYAESDEDDAPPAKKPRAKAKPKAEKEDGEPVAKSKGKGKASVWPPADLDPADHPGRAGHPIYALPPLTAAPNGGIASTSTLPRPLYVGAHTSIAGGMATALFRAGKAGANGVAMFVKSQRQWKSNPFEQDVIDKFHAAMKPKEEGGVGYGPETILVHGSYLINLGNPDPVKWNTSYQCFKDDIYRCHQLGIKMYNWHPGSTVGACSKEDSYKTIAKAINRVHKEVPEVVTVIENMANAKSNLVGTTFYDLKEIIALVEDKDRVRICLDTCHLFAAGYDIRTRDTYRETMRKFDEGVGNGYLAGVHLNDSKAELGGCKDLHENIGLGQIGLTAFREIMRDPLMEGIPLILETPAASNPLEAGELSLWVREIKMLYEIQAIEDDEWESKSVEIEARWRAERDKINPPKEKKVKEKKEPAAKGKAKSKKKKDEEECESHGEDSD